MYNLAHRDLEVLCCQCVCCQPYAALAVAAGASAPAYEYRNAANLAYHEGSYPPAPHVVLGAGGGAEREGSNL